MKIFSRTIIALSIILLGTSCTDVDKKIGLDFVPGDQEVSLIVDTLHPNFYTVTLDSLYSNMPTALSFGSYYDQIFGTTTAGIAFQVVPSVDSINFGTNPRADSLILQIYLKDRVGDENYAQTINVYELNKRIYVDSIYYPATPINNMINPTPVGTYTYQPHPVDKWDITDTLRIRLSRDLGQRLLTANSTQMNLDSVNLFYDFFKGLYITTDAVATGTTGRINILPASSMYLFLYYNREGKDTTAYYYNITSSMATFETVKHDYSTATHLLKIQHINDTIASANIDSLIYLQGLYGVTPAMKIRNNDIKKWLADNNLQSDKIIISRAILEIDAQEVEGYDLYNYADTLGLFYSVHSKGSDSIIRPNLTAVTEMSSSLFGGTFNRTFNKYTFKISYDFTQAVKNINDGKNIYFVVSPYYTQTDSYYGYTYRYSEQAYMHRMILKGTTSSRPPRLIISYAKIQ